MMWFRQTRAQEKPRRRFIVLVESYGLYASCRPKTYSMTLNAYDYDDATQRALDAGRDGHWARVLEIKEIY